jgi:hypothetical protein
VVKGSKARVSARDKHALGRVIRPQQGLGAPITWALSPSDFAFLWDECQRCFFNKVVLKQPRPRAPFPGVFTRIDQAMKAFYLGERADALVSAMPPGVIGGGDRWVKSEPIVPPGAATGCLIRGRVDVLVAGDDGSTAVIDFKTAEPSPANLEKYSRQLHAYALALERPASGPATMVSALGLLCFLPTSFAAVRETATLHGDLRWIEVERDDEAFFDFLAGVLVVLERASAPLPSGSCPWCAWRPDDPAGPEVGQ